jgi:hypothetical protein
MTSCQIAARRQRTKRLFIPPDSRLQFWTLNHIPADTINGEPACRKSHANGTPIGHHRIDVNDPKQKSGFVDSGFTHPYNQQYGALEKGPRGDHAQPEKVEQP